MMISQQSSNHSGVGLLVTIVLAIWFVIVFLLGAIGAFVRPPGAPPFPILLGATFPLVVFIAAYLGSGAFRALILGADLRLLTAIQAWRAGGLGFLALYAHGLLPGLFAWPAGLGDIAIGVTAPWVVLALIRRPAFAAGRLFVVWNLLGILDLVVAVSTGALEFWLHARARLRKSRPPRWHSCRSYSYRRTLSRCSSCSILPRFFQARRLAASGHPGRQA